MTINIVTINIALATNVKCKQIKKYIPSQSHDVCSLHQTLYLIIIIIILNGEVACIEYAKRLTIYHINNHFRHLVANNDNILAVTNAVTQLNLLYDNLQ